MRATGLKPIRICFAFCVLFTFQSLVANGQTLWITSGTPNDRHYNARLMHQERDTLYFVDPGKGEWDGQYYVYWAYFLRGDSIFRQKLPYEALYILSHEPDTLSAAMTGPFYMGRHFQDSIVMENWNYRKRPIIYKKAASVTISQAKRAHACWLLENYSIVVDKNAVRGTPGSTKPMTEKMPRKEKANYEGDPFPTVRGLYEIEGFCFLFLPVDGEKLFQIVDVGEREIVVESLCGDRRVVKVQTTSEPAKEIR